MTVTIQLADSDVEWCKKQVAKFINPKEHKRVLESSKSKLIGYFGECAFKQLRPAAQHFDSTHFDFISNGKKIDVKTREKNNFPDDMKCFFVSADSRKRQPEFYVFAFADLERHQVDFVGWMSYKQIEQCAVLKKAGDTIDGKHKVKVDTFVIFKNKLKPLGKS
jgi:hypothetical protein